MGAAENAVQNQCLEYLARTNTCLVAGRTNNNAVYDKKRGLYRSFSKYAIRGLTDLMAWAMPGKLPKGTMAVIECKTPEGTTSPEQRDFLTAVATTGNTAMLIRNVTELIDVMEGRIQPEPETGVFVPSGKWHLRTGEAHKPRAPRMVARRRRW